MIKKTRKSKTNDINQYTHDGEKRSNNPPVGLVTPGTDPDSPSKRYSFDPRLDPQLQWSGKSENSEFDVDTVSLHVHERIDPITILEKAMKPKKATQETMFNYFETPENNPPLREAIDFYKHDQNWSNRLIAGDSLLVMNSLLEKEGMEGKVQMIYMDPPYGIKYGSNFQPFINKKIVQDGKDEDLTQEPEMIRAFRDTWELGVHSYLSYLRDRLFLAKKLLTETGSCFVQISDENVHYVRELMNEIFDKKNFISQIIFVKTSGFPTNYLSSTNDYLIWYAKDKTKLKYRQLFLDKQSGRGITAYKYIELEDGVRRKLTSTEFKNPDEIPKGKLFRISDIQSQGTSNNDQKFIFEDNTYLPRSGSTWKVTLKGLNSLAEKNRIMVSAGIPQFVRYLDDFPVNRLTNIWNDTATGSFTDKKIYVVQTGTKTIQRCILMTTDPGDLVLDPTCGSGTTAFTCEQWGRRWITCDTSRIALNLAKQRLMTTFFDYYQFKYPIEGICSGFNYKTVPHVTLGSIANNDPAKEEILSDQPIINKTKSRISGPFTVEAVPSPVVNSIDALSENIDDSFSQNVNLQNSWRDELLKTGIRGKGGQKIEFSSVHTHPATKWLHADAVTKDNKRMMISFGPEHAPLEQRQVALAIEEAQNLVPKPKMIIFTAMQFDPEAAKDIDELKWPDVTILKVEINKDLLTQDLKKKRSSNESFWLMGQPDIELQKTKDGKYIIIVNGFDYYNTRNRRSRIRWFFKDCNVDVR